MANNPFGRMLSLIREEAENQVGSIPRFQVGEMVTGAQIKVGDRKLSRDDYVLIENRFTVEVDGDKKTFRVPYKKKQEFTLKAAKDDTGSGSGKQQTIKISVPPLKEGDQVLCYQISDEKYAVFGRVVES